MSSSAEIHSMESPGQHLKFPLTWHGTLIAHREAGDMAPLIRDLFQRMGLSQATLAPGNKSTAGTYATWKLSAELQDYETMLALFANLERLPGAKMLI